MLTPEERRHIERERRIVEALKDYEIETVVADVNSV
jgi:hypothetical protein